MPYRRGKDSPQDTQKDLLPTLPELREALLNYGRGGTGPEGLRRILRRLPSVWMVQLRGQWRREDNHIIVGFTENGLAHLGAPESVPTMTGLLQVFDHAAGVLLDPRGPQPTQLPLSVVYAITGIPGMVPYRGVPLRARNHAEIHAYLDSLGWPEGWRGHRLVLPEGEEAYNEYSTEGAPPEVPSVVRFVVAEPELFHGIDSLAPLHILDPVAWIVKSDLWLEAIAAAAAVEPHPSAAELTLQRLERSDAALGLACSRLLRREDNAAWLTPTSQLVAQLVPERLDAPRINDALEPIMRRRKEAVLLVASEREVASEQQVGDGCEFAGALEEHAESIRSDVVQGRRPSLTIDELPAAIHLLMTSSHIPVLRWVMRELHLLQFEIGEDDAILPTLSDAVFRHLSSADLILVDQTFLMVHLILQRGYRPALDKVAELYELREHVVWKQELLLAAYWCSGPPIHAGVESMFLRALHSSDPRVVGYALRHCDARAPRIFDAVVPLLQHAWSSVRESAATVLGRSEQLSVIPALVGLLNDTERDTFTRDVKWLGPLEVGPRPSAVNLAALGAVQQLSELTAAKLEIAVDWHTVDEAPREAIDAAKKWYARMRPHDGQPS